MMKRKLYLLLVIIFCNLLYSEDIFLEILKDTDVYKSTYSSKKSGIIKRGEKVQFYDSIVKNIDEFRLRILIDDNKRYIDSKYTIVSDNKEKIEDVINDGPFLMSYYQEVLKNSDRLSLLPFEDWETNYESYMGEEQWWDAFSSLYSKVYIKNSFIKFSEYNDTDIIILKTKKKISTYHLTVKKITTISSFLKLDWSPVEGKEFFTMILKLDGDYIDVYLENEDTKLCELIRVDKPFVDALIDVVQHGKKVDLTKINWPQRANKDQAEEDATTAKKNYYTPTVNNLRFRATPTLDGRFIRHLKAGERLELIERGKSETIGDAKGTWVKVKTAQGEVGWCFDAYLKEVE